MTYAIKCPCTFSLIIKYMENQRWPDISNLLPTKNIDIQGVFWLQKPNQWSTPKKTSSWRIINGVTLPRRNSYPWFSCGSWNQSQHLTFIFRNRLREDWHVLRDIKASKHVITSISWSNSSFLKTYCKEILTVFLFCGCAYVLGLIVPFIDNSRNWVMY